MVYLSNRLQSDIVALIISQQCLMLCLYNSGIEPVKQIFSARNCDYFLIHRFKYVFLGAQKNRLIETILLSTHNRCFAREIRK